MTTLTTLHPIENAINRELRSPGFVETCDPRFAASSNLALNSGTVRFVMIPIEYREVLTQVAMVTGGTLAAGLTLARMGVYVRRGSSWALASATANDTTLFTAAQNYTRSLTEPVIVGAGDIIAVAVLCVGTTAPTLCGVACPTNLSGLIGNRSYRSHALLTSQTDLPATVTDASLSSSGSLYWARLW